MNECFGAEIKSESFEVVPIDEFDLKESRKGYFGIFKRVIVPYDVITYKSIDGPKIGVESQWESYFKIVPCNPLLSFLGLLRFDKNQKEFEPKKEIRYADEAAREFCEKYKDVFKDRCPQIVYIEGAE